MKHRCAVSTSGMPWVTRVCLGAVLTFVLGCSGNSASEGARAALIGGWSNPDANLFACFAADGRMWLGDSRSELGGASHCVADASGASFECTDPDDGDSFGGNVGSSGDELTLDLVPCLPDAECHALYFRDASVTCER